MRDFWRGFIAGAKETPRGFFAPLIVIWRLFIFIYDGALKHDRTQSR